MTYRINPENGKSESRVDMLDPYSSGYRPAVSVDLSAHVRQEAIAAHKRAIAQAETDKIERPVTIKGIDWSLALFLATMALIGLAIGLGIALVMS